jgi:hypothetical protein
LRFSSITTRMPDLSDSSRMSDALDLLLVDQLGDLLEQGLLVNLVRQFVDDDGLAVALPMSSKWVRARITTRPRPVR